MDEMDRLFRQSDFSAENEGLGTRIWNRVIRRKEEPVIMPIQKKPRPTWRNLRISNWRTSS